MKTDILMILMKARETLENGWCQKAQARSASGEAVRPWEKEASAYCLLGGIMNATGEQFLPLQGTALKAINVLGDLIIDRRDRDSTCRVVKWNDCEERKKEEVLDLIDKGIASLLTQTEMEKVNEPESVF